MGQALYRKYRSRKLSEVVGQEHITKTLNEALKQQKISHAYLFSGPRGVGKTSVARIIAHEVNRLAYTDDVPYLDIIEIDAASNRRIDEIRDLRQKVNIAPAAAQFKVYIIDEVHMLTREAFNALLKTLEEPPAHVIFILATTEAHKLPETIVSRTQRFNFKPIGKSKIAEHLRQIATNEKIKIDNPALLMLAEHGDGSFRDSISMLDQLAANRQTIDEMAVRALLGLPSKQTVAKLLEQTIECQLKGALETLNQLYEEGANAATIAVELAKQLRQQIVDSGSFEWSLRLLRALSAIPASQRPQDELEISLIEAAARNDKTTTDNRPSVNVNSAKESGANKDALAKSNLKEAAVKTSPQPALLTKTFKLEDWPQVVSTVKDEAASLYTALRLAAPTLQDNELILTFNFPLHQKKVAQSKNLALIETKIKKIAGSTIKISCVVNKSLAAAEFKQEPAAKRYLNDSMTAVSNIFPAAEMLES